MKTTTITTINRREDEMFRSIHKEGKKERRKGRKKEERKKGRKEGDKNR